MFVTLLFAMLAGVAHAGKRVIVLADQNDVCINNAACRASLHSNAELIVNSGYYDQGWVLQEDGNWTQSGTRKLGETMADKLSKIEGLVPRGPEDSEGKRGLRGQGGDDQEMRRLLSCEACVDLYGSYYVCVFYNYCRRRLNIMQSDVATIKEINSPCYTSISMDYDAWLYTAMVWLYEQHGLDQYIVGVSYRVEELKNNPNCVE